MLLRTVIFAAVVGLVATQIPAIVQLTGDPSAAPSPAAGQPQQLNATPAKAPASASAMGSMTLEADNRGHFNGTFRINGKSIDGMVDTGASLVAINESMARKLGFTANGLDFRYSVSTANGSADAARITLDRVEIGNVRVKDVDAMVMRDKSLSGMLVGMSFLKKLKSFQVEDGNLKLVQ